MLRGSVSPARLKAGSRSQSRARSSSADRAAAIKEAREGTDRGAGAKTSFFFNNRFGGRDEFRIVGGGSYSCNKALFLMQRGLHESCRWNLQGGAERGREEGGGRKGEGGRGREVGSDRWEKTDEGLYRNESWIAILSADSSLCYSTMWLVFQHRARSFCPPRPHPKRCVVQLFRLPKSWGWPEGALSENAANAPRGGTISPKAAAPVGPFT